MRRISDSMAQSQKSMAQMTESNNRASDALSIIELILAGSVIIEIVLMFFGEYAMPDAWISNLFLDRFGGLIIIGVTILLWFGVFVFLRQSKKRLESAAVRRQRGSYVIGKRCNLENLGKYLDEKDIMVRNVEGEGDSEIISVTWEEKERKSKNIPKISAVVLNYDAREEFLIHMEFETPDMSCDLKSCYEFLTKEMTDSGVFQIVIDGESC